MKNNFDLWVNSSQTLKKRITELKIAILIIAICGTNIMAFPSGNEPQQKAVTGTVTDKNGIALAGVNVVVAGTTVGAMSDINGKYSIDMPQVQKVLHSHLSGW